MIKAWDNDEGNERKKKGGLKVEVAERQKRKKATQIQTET